MTTRSRVPSRITDITPAWMTTALSADHPGAVVGSLDVGSIERGTNTRARVAVTYDRGAGPSSVFVKGPGSWGNRLALAALGALYSEARLASARASLPLEHPRFYASAVDRGTLAALVLMADVVDAGGRPNDATRALDVAEVGSGLAALARLHGAYWERQLPTCLAFLRPWRLGPGWGAVSVASLSRGLRRLADTGSPRGACRGLDARRLGSQFRRSALLAASGPQTVLHGDPHPGNTYAAGSGGTGFFDWQLVRTGNWSHDVGYFLVSSLEVSDRRRHESRLLAGYLEALRSAGTDAPDFETAWSRYRATPAFGLCTWLHTLSFGTFQPHDVCLATIERFASAYDDLGTRRSLVASED